MTQFLQARLVNDRFGDPVLYLDFNIAKRALLFDLGDLGRLSAREILRVSHIFVSHAHMDHFAGFDRVLRLCLHRTAPLMIVGPSGFIGRVEAKLRAYTWNLLDATSVDFTLRVAEFGAGGFEGRAVFRARDAFETHADRRETGSPGDILLSEDDFTIRAAVLDHGTPCLAFAFIEALRVNVVREGLDALRLRPGPWLTQAKRAIRLDLAEQTPIETGDGRTLTLGDLKSRAFRTAPGQKVVYIVDTADHPANHARAVALAAGADQLFIEAAFADEDAVLAHARHHLTAGAAGRIAREAGVKRVIPLHLSTRYENRPETILSQVNAAFGGA